VSAGLLGEGVKVVFDADVPHADLTNRVMHLRPLPEEISEEALLHLRADCDHEMGHFGFTDPKALENCAEAKTRPIVRLLGNAIEDGYIERRVSERWLGCAQNLAASNAAIRRELREKFESEDLAEDDILNARRALAVSGLTILAFGGTLEEVYATFGDEIAPLYVSVADILPKLSEVKSTRDSMRLAVELANRWRWGRDEEPPAPKPPIEVPPGAGSSITGGGAGGQGGGVATRVELEHERRVAEAIEPTLVGDMRKHHIAEHAFVDHYRYRAYTDEDVVEVLQPVADASAVAAFVKSVRHVVPSLRRRLIMEFSGIGQRFHRNRKRGEFDQRAAHKVRLGSEHVFRVKAPRIVVDADVELLVDISGSMCRGIRGKRVPKLHVAAQAATAFSMVLDKLRIAHECAAFTTQTRFSDRFGYSLGDDEHEYERTRPLRLILAKPAGMRFRQCRGRFAALAAFEECCDNVDGESVMWAAQRLAARNRRGMKPILIVFSDGWPASSPEEFSVLNAHLKRTVERVSAAGITVIGVGIASDAVAKFYPEHIVIEDVSDLVGTSYRLIRAALRGARRRAS
jgi:hypothetical protein